MFKTAFILFAFLSVTAFSSPKPIHLHPVSDVFATDVQCMTDNLYREAPDEGRTGMLAVATVVMNRVHTKGFPKNVCMVVYEHGQFSWTASKHLPTPNPELYAKARQIALEVVKRGKRLLSIKNALYYHRIDCTPNWDHVQLIATIGNHAFFTATRN